jgi:hypothetical protein
MEQKIIIKTNQVISNQTQHYNSYITRQHKISHLTPTNNDKQINYPYKDEQMW